MNTKNNSSDSFLDQIGLGGLIIVALLVLTLVVATSRGIPKMERDLQGRSTAALQAIGVETSPDSLHFEGRDAHLVLPAESAMDEQVVAEKLREVRGVRRVFLVREDDGEIMAPGEPTEDGDEKRAPVAVTAEQESAAIEGAKLGLADVGDGKGAAVESTPAATTRDEAAIKEEAIKEELSVATRTGGSSATEEERPEVPHEIALEPTAHVPGVSDGPVEIQPSASTDVATNQTGISGATGAQPARDESVDASPSMATSAEPVAQQASDVGTRRSTSVSPPRAAPSVTTEQTGTHAGSAAGEAVVQSPVESASGGQWKSGDESIAGESTGDKSAVDGSITDKVMSQARNGARMISDEARNAGTVAGQGGQAADAAEIAGAQGEQPSGFGAGQEAAKEPALGVAQEPRLNLEFDPAGIRVSGRVADQQAVQQVEETLRSAAKRDISFALSTGSARGSMPWLTGAAEVVAGLRPDDHGRMTMSEGGGVGIQIPPGSISQASAITERLKQRFMSAYPDADAAADDAGVKQARTGAQTAGSSSVAGDSTAISDQVEDATRSPADELNELLGSNPLFAVGSYQVSGELAGVLDRIADYFKTNPGVAVGLTARPDAGVMFPLSMVVGISRAFSVRSYLILKGIQPANVLVGDPPLGVSPTGKQQIEFYQHRVMF